MKKDRTNLILVLIFIIGLSVMLYPTVSDYWNSRTQSRAVATYNETVESMSEEDYEEMFQEAEAYNEALSQVSMPFVNFDQVAGYEDILDVSGTGIMGYISIPEIDVRLPIYHGTSDPVLQIGAGHMYGTGLPVGGEGNHSVIAGHRGLPSARLFTDLDQLETGDKFYLHVLDKVLAYEVDQISDMVDKDDIDTLTSLMQKQEGEDLVTLFTCTPYGINSHRLLIRGHQVEYHGEDEENEDENTMLRSVREYYMLYGLALLAALLLLAVIIRFVRRKKVLKYPGRKKNE